MSLRHLLLWIPLLIAAAAALPGWVRDAQASSSSSTFSPDEEPVASPTELARVAFRVAGMKKARSGAT